MKEITIQTYKFSELSDDAKQKAIEKHWDIMTTWSWWEFIYEDAKRIGLNIRSFDVYYRQIDIVYEVDPDDVANAILKDYGEAMDIYKCAAEYLERYKQIEEIVDEDEILPSDELEELNEEFLQSMGKCFLNFLESEYQWRTSNEAIGEELEINDYDFTADGRRFNY